MVQKELITSNNIDNFTMMKRYKICFDVVFDITTSFLFNQRVGGRSNDAWCIIAHGEIPSNDFFFF